jgi:uncharacterized spore protein YtfJ
VNERRSVLRPEQPDPEDAAGTRSAWQEVLTMTTDHSGAEEEARKAAEGSAADRLLERIVERLGGRSGVRAAFGEPVERGDITVVPVARLRWAFGAGEGSGPASGAEGGPVSAGAGGGGGVSADPIGYIEISPSGAAFRPIVEPYPRPMFLLAAGVTAALILRAFARLLRG